MSGSNAEILNIALRNFTKEKYDAMQQKLLTHCEEILDQAIQFRFGANNAHNFTGNLVNSIVVGLWREGKFVQGFLPGSRNNVEMVRRKKMTATGGIKGSGWYKFRIDYDTVPNTMYHATVATDEGKGRNDAIAFLESFKPDKNAIFQIVVGYTTEYASWVESVRGTTGYLQTVEWVKMNTEKAIA